MESQKKESKKIRDYTTEVNHLALATEHYGQSNELYLRAKCHLSYIV